MPKKVKGINKSSKKVMVILSAFIVLGLVTGLLVWFLRKKDNRLVPGNQPFSNPSELRLAILDYYGNGNTNSNGGKKRKEEVVKKYGLIKNWDLSQMTSLESAFAAANVTNPLNEKSSQGLSKEDLSKWDVSSVENMQEMCYGNKHFNNGTLMYWDVSNVTNMNQSFAKSGFIIDISSWNVSNVVDMYGIFQDSNFNIDISGWDVSKVKVWDDAFLNCPLGAPGNVNLLPLKFR